MTNPLLSAEAPALIQVLKAVQQFTADLGPNPVTWPVNAPGALLKLNGSIALAVPQLELAAGTTAVTEFNNLVQTAIDKLQNMSK